MDILYVYPCLACGHPTASDYDKPTTCEDCAPHTCERAWYVIFSSGELIEEDYCSICDKEMPDDVVV